MGSLTRLTGVTRATGLGPRHAPAWAVDHDRMWGLGALRGPELHVGGPGSPRTSCPLDSRRGPAGAGGWGRGVVRGSSGRRAQPFMSAAWSGPFSSLINVCQPLDQHLMSHAMIIYSAAPTHAHSSSQLAVPAWQVRGGAWRHLRNPGGPGGQCHPQQWAGRGKWEEES